MQTRHALLAVALAAALLPLAACKRSPSPETGTTGAQQVPADETADQFVARVNREIREITPELTSAQWLSATYINGDSETVAAKANERWLARLNGWIEQARRFEGKPMSPQTAQWP